MRKILAIIAGKLSRLLLKLAGKGSSLPGKIALMIDPKILSKLKLPKYVIAVTGSNGKTSTVEMINAVLCKSGFRVAYNFEGSNQIEGVTTFLINNANITGEVLADVVLLESDERYARHIFKHFTPSHYIITNLYRDQLTRNGHPEWVFNILKDSIKEGCQLILNGDDPLVSCFGVGREAVYFSMKASPIASSENVSVYDDGVYCPNCNSRLRYAYRNYNHIGRFCCPNCHLGSIEPKYCISDVNLEAGYLLIDDKLRIDLAFKSIYNAYNILAVYALSKELNIRDEVIAEALNNYILKNGRVVEFAINDKKGTLLASKHENSISYDMNLRVATSDQTGCTVVILVDAISRKYFTSETSWLWDIDFELLAKANIKKVVLTGRYAADLALRLSYAEVDAKKIHISRDIQGAIDYLKTEAIGHIYALTCFSDLDKLLSKVEVSR